MFKITGGKYRGAKLWLPPESITRPTSIRAREALFNCLFSLEFPIEGATVIDGFAGSGAIGLECLSRGAGFCTFVESHSDVQKTLKTNISKLHMTEKSKVISDFQKVETLSDFVFLDPPYSAQERGQPLYRYALNSIKGCIKENAIIVVETKASESPVTDPYRFLFSKTYGTVKLSFFTARQGTI